MENKTIKYIIGFILFALFFFHILSSMNASPEYIYYRDADGDGYGYPGDKVYSTEPTPPPGYADNCLDCYDDDPTSPGDKYKKK